jgi:flagellum-specific ATP synthase
VAVPVVNGSVAGVVGHEVEVRGLRMRVGDAIAIDTAAGRRVGQVVSVRQGSVRALVMGDATGLGAGDRVTPIKGGLTFRVSESLIGRVLDGSGRPIDGGPPIEGELVTAEGTVPHPLARRRIQTPLPTGVRLVDGLCTVGRGQRIGLFGGSGVGKSTLLGMIARGTEAEVTVLALIGERGREVREFIEEDLGPEGLARCVVVVATSDQAPLVRVRGALVATRIAEWFADRGQDVLLMFDSVTRVAMAQREVGLAAGEPPTARGYTPSVFSLLPALMERTGPREHGTITAIYTVLVDGDDMQEPIADAARSILDGHLVLSRRMAESHRFPALDPLASLSRLAPRITEPEQRRSAGAMRNALAAIEDVRDMVEVGAYVPGSNPEADRGMAAKGAIDAFLRQDMHEVAAYGDTWDRLHSIGRELS